MCSQTSIERYTGDGNLQEGYGTVLMLDSQKATNIDSAVRPLGDQDRRSDYNDVGEAVVSSDVEIACYSLGCVSWPKGTDKQ